MSFSSPVRRVLGSSLFAGEETGSREVPPKSAWRSLSPELVLPRCCLPLAPQLQPAPQPWAPQEPHSCVIVPLSPQHTGCWWGGGEWAAAEFCGIGWKLPSHPVQSHFCCARLCTHTSLLHARRSVSCTHSWPLGHTCPGTSQEHTQHTSNAKKSNAQLLPPFLCLHRRTPGPARQPRPLGRS